MANIYEDEYFRTFGSNDYMLLKQAQKELEDSTVWETGVSDMEVLPLESPMAALTLASDPSNTIPYDLLDDTAANAGIMLRYNGKTACLRNCAMRSLLTTTGISGPGISRAEKVHLATGLTAFLTGSREKSQIMTRAGKVSAVLSHHYQYMPGTELLEICDELETTFGPAQFRGGSVAHDLLTAEFAYPAAAPKITAAYNSVLDPSGRGSSQDILPIIQFRTSDTSNEAATLMAMLKRGTSIIPLCCVKVYHTPPLEFDNNNVRLTPMSVFRRESGMLYAQMEMELTDQFTKMLNVPIDYPGNTFLGLCAYANIPRKWGGVVEEELRANWPDHSGCTFLDVYEALADVQDYALQDPKVKQNICDRRILELQEGIYKIVKNRAVWKKYDLPGTSGWSLRAA